MAERFELTASSVLKRCHPPAPGEVNANGRPVTQKIYWDSKLAGFGLLVGHTAKTFIVQRDFGGKTKRRKIDRYPTLAVKEARDAAREMLVKLGKGEDPKDEARAKAEGERKREWETFTLREGVAHHIANMRVQGCSDRTPRQMEDELGRLVGDWMDEPLVAIRRKDCIERHRKITSDNGPAIANRVMRMVRAVWNSAWRLYEELPPHPVIGVALNKERRRREPIPWADLSSWWDKVRSLPNPYRRDLNLVMLFTGLRATDASTIRWEHVDFAKGTLHRPKPKGGEDKAFTIPLSRFVLRLLRRRKALAGLYFPEGDGGWAFPTRNRSGAVVATREPKEQRFEDLPNGKRKKSFLLPSPHRLRDTFATTCLEAGVGHTETKILLNHSLPNDDVTMGYQRPSTEHLRGCVEKVATFLREKRREGRDRQLAEQKKAKAEAEKAA